MSIFDFFSKSKRKAQQNEQRLLDEEGTEEADLQSKTYVVEPQHYEKGGKEKFSNFVITEGVNTTLPIYPNGLYKDKEESFSDIRLTFVNTTKKGGVVDLPFFHCIPTLSNYAMGYREPNILIRGLNAAEMDLLILDVKQSLKHI